VRTVVKLIFPLVSSASYIPAVDAARGFAVH
jgi:hypothetical protein